MREEFVSVEELMAELREQGLEDCRDVKAAYIEANGNIKHDSRRDGKVMRTQKPKGHSCQAAAAVTLDAAPDNITWPSSAKSWVAKGSHQPASGVAMAHVSVRQPRLLGVEKIGRMVS